MKKLFAIIAVAGLLTACNNEEAAKKEAADKATADSLKAQFVADSIKAATASPMIDSMKAKMEGAVDKMKPSTDKMKAKMEGAVDKK
jgi:PBP1b-binding outer membrane lipoprotein LpoB